MSNTQSTLDGRSTGWTDHGINLAPKRRAAVLNSYARTLDKRFDSQGRLRFNLILATDAYKFSHPFAYPNYVNGMYAYQEARTRGKDIMVPFGMQMLLWKTLANPITRDDIEEAAAFCEANGTLFHREGWEYILETYDGYIPVKIRAVPEGTPVPSGNVMVTVECTDVKVFWVTSYIETFLLRGIWYPTTIATNDRALKKQLKHLFELSGASMDMLVWMINDFGARGVSAGEVAEIGGSAHMVSFMGSDTIEGIRAANLYYKCAMASYGVPATEHSIECSFGLDEEGEEEYLEHVLTTLAKPGGIVSIVIDGKDVYRATKKLCSGRFIDLIKNCQAKVVLRPDSGDMMEIVPWILEMLAKTFGYKKNAKGYRYLEGVGVIQGDGIDMVTARSLIGKLVALNWQADVIVLGSGGGLLQKVNRDTYKFAQKASAIRIDVAKTGGHDRIERYKQEGKSAVDSFDGEGFWIGISKDPVTDPGKQSKAGRVSLAYNAMSGEYKSYDLDLEYLEEGWADALVTVYDNGVLCNETTLDEVRARAAI